VLFHFFPRELTESLTDGSARHDLRALIGKRVYMHFSHVLFIKTEYRIYSGRKKRFRIIFCNWKLSYTRNIVYANIMKISLRKKF